ncbi:MAG: phosphohistidine phosphatase SixA [Planctomycetota bacterium]|jgi:phosphohistidine phosphatase
MKLYLVQHAKAASKQADRERGLTEGGRREVQKISEFVKPLNICVDYLWDSGKKRSVQTAEILAEVVKINETHTTREGLEPNDDVTLLKDELASIQRDVMIVGHLPFLSKLASLLLSGCESSDTVALRQGGIVCLNCSEPDQWQIDWMVTPELLA